VVRGAGDVVPSSGYSNGCAGGTLASLARRSLEFYDALGRVMAVKGNA
jgi:hypothetical protein